MHNGHFASLALYTGSRNSVSRVELERIPTSLNLINLYSNSAWRESESDTLSTESTSFEANRRDVAIMTTVVYVIVSTVTMGVMLFTW